jgi:N-terminal EH-domain containing protein
MPPAYTNSTLPRSMSFNTYTDSKRYIPHSKYKSVVQGLKDIYTTKIRPIEELYNYDAFYSAPLSDAEIEAKPMVLLLGQYSTGKTSFITKLLGQNYPGAHIGPEPTVIIYPYYFYVLLIIDG